MSTIIWDREDITIARGQDGTIRASTWWVDETGTDQRARVECETMADAVEMVQVWLELMGYLERYALEVLMTIPGRGESWELVESAHGPYVVDLEDTADA